uniref:Uncharacterized protein n=1 Tax=Quercus lobata TaxID=97700 RepID=A0A7N2R0J5_QUELO
MKLVLTHSENIKTSAYISRHLELEAERMGAHQNTLLVAQPGQRKAFRPKHKRQGRNAKAAGNLGPKDGKIANCQKANVLRRTMQRLSATTVVRRVTSLLSALSRRRRDSSSLSCNMKVFHKGDHE